MKDSNEEPHCNTRMCDFRSHLGPPRGVVNSSLCSSATENDDAVTMFQETDLEKNLIGNGVMDEPEEYGRCGMAINHLIPVVSVRYTDGLTDEATSVYV